MQVDLFKERLELGFSREAAEPSSEVWSFLATAHSKPPLAHAGLTINTCWPLSATESGIFLFGFINKDIYKVIT